MIKLVFSMLVCVFVATVSFADPLSKLPEKYFRQEWVVKGIPQPKDQIAADESAVIAKSPIRSYPYYRVLYDQQGRVLSMAKYLKGTKQYEYDFEYVTSEAEARKVTIYTPGKGDAVFYEKK